MKFCENFRLSRISADRRFHYLLLQAATLGLKLRLLRKTVCTAKVIKKLNANIYDVFFRVKFFERAERKTARRGGRVGQFGPVGRGGRPGVGGLGARVNGIKLDRAGLNEI